MVNFFANEFTRLGAGGFPLAFVPPGTFDRFSIGHDDSFLLVAAF
jgi:hypothetical protein